MSTKSRTFAIGLLLLGSMAFEAVGQRSSRGRVAVTCSCEDVTGRAYASALHEALAKSSHYREVGLNEALETNAIRISIVSLSIDDAGSGHPPRAALSIVYIHDGAIIHQFVETCTNIPIKDCAEAMVANLLYWDNQSS